MWSRSRTTRCASQTPSRRTLSATCHTRSGRRAAFAASERPANSVAARSVPALTRDAHVRTSTWPERGAPGPPRLDEPFQPGKRARDDAHTVADPDPGHRPRSAAHGDDTAYRLYFLVGNRAQRVPPLAKDAHDAVGARDLNVSLA